MNNDKLEIWLRGKVPGVPDLLQPAAHALLQSAEEVEKYMIDFPEELLWVKPAGRASVGFHLQHLSGVTDRMLTYAKAEKLSGSQISYLENEGKPDERHSVRSLVQEFQDKVEQGLELFRKTPENSLTEFRPVGREKMPSSVIGVLFHAAEHSQRHVGQLLVSVSFLKLKENRQN